MFGLIAHQPIFEATWLNTKGRNQTYKFKLAHHSQQPALVKVCEASVFFVQDQGISI